MLGTSCARTYGLRKRWTGGRHKCRGVWSGVLSIAFGPGLDLYEVRHSRWHWSQFIDDGHCLHHSVFWRQLAACTCNAPMPKYSLLSFRCRLDTRPEKAKFHLLHISPSTSDNLIFPYPLYELVIAIHLDYYQVARQL
jgi:hypothetical protein